MRILLTGGGSGGHFYPLIAVAQEINRISREEKLIQAEVYFMSDDPYDKAYLFDNDITFLKVPAGKARRYFSLKNYSDTLKTLTGVIKAIIKMFDLYPDVVFSKGGYASFPAVLAAKLFKIPVFIHESDSVPGRTNRWAGKFALRIAVSFPEAAKYFPSDRVALTGNPVRREIKAAIREGSFELLNFDPKIPTILFLGGSLGAEIINNTVMEMLPELVKKYQIVHQTGTKNIKEIEQVSSVALNKNPLKNRYRCFDYLDDTSLRMAAGAANLIISRAGSTIFEIALWEKPSIIIPIADSNGDHQRKNAFTYSASGACVVIEEANLKPHILLSEINRLIEDKPRLAKMAAGAKNFSKPDAAAKIAREIINICLSHEN